MARTKLTSLFGINRDEEEDMEVEKGLETQILQEGQQAKLEQDISILDDDDGATEERLHRVAEKEVQSAAEDSLKKLHVVQMGRCPVCAEHLSQHLFASVCEACGWYTFDVPANGPVRVHLRSGGAPIEGERCYAIKTGAVLVLKNDLVVARVPRDACSWIEYSWSEDEIEQRHKQIVDRMQLNCGWCSGPVDPEKDGFHLVHAAFGATQERYCLCSDECYEAFRKMYPARVHRDCYERSCDDCNLCIKRYGPEAEGVRMLAKDFLSLKKKKKR